MDRSSFKKFVQGQDWQYDSNHSGGQVEFFWQVCFPFPKKQLWEVLSDTSSINQKVGFGQLSFEEKKGQLVGQSKVLKSEQIWTELPWVWHYGRLIRSEREYQKGWLSYFKAMFYLEEKADHTRVSFHFGFYGLTPFAKFFLKAVESRFKKRYVKSITALLNKNKSPVLTEISPLSLINKLNEGGEEKLSKLSDLLNQHNIEKRLIDNIIRMIKNSEDKDLDRIRVLPLALKWGVAVDELIQIFIILTKAGFFYVSWDIICPHCKGVREESRTLKELSQESVCEPCNVIVKTDSENAIEITFHVDPSIRKISKVVYCAAEPAKKSHLILQHHLKKQASIKVPLELKSGFYRLRENIENNFLGFEVSQTSKKSDLVWRMEKSQSSASLVLSERFTLDVINILPSATMLTIEKLHEKDEVLKPSHVMSLPEFRGLMIDDFLSSSVKIFLGHQVILFTDIVGSTAMYEEVGDMQAFNLVSQHFKRLEEIIRYLRGSVVKTIGDSVMATFANLGDAMKAAEKIAFEFSGSNPERILCLRQSLHKGPVLAVNMNVGIDYFGQAVNYAAKLQSFAQSGEVALSQSVFEAISKDKDLGECFEVQEKLSNKSAQRVYILKPKGRSLRRTA